MRCKCGKVLKVGSQHAGRKLKCPKCGVAVEVPEAVAAGSARKRSGAPSGDGWRDSYKEFGAQDYTTAMMPQAKRPRKKKVQAEDGEKKVAQVEEVNSSKTVMVSRALVPPSRDLESPEFASRQNMRTSVDASRDRSSMRSCQSCSKG